MAILSKKDDYKILPFSLMHNNFIIRMCSSYVLNAQAFQMLNFVFLKIIS